MMLYLCTKTCIFNRVNKLTCSQGMHCNHNALCKNRTKFTRHSGGMRNFIAAGRHRNVVFKSIKGRLYRKNRLLDVNNMHIQAKIKLAQHRGGHIIMMQQ